MHTLKYWGLCLISRLGLVTSRANTQGLVSGLAGGAYLAPVDLDDSPRNWQP
jgi:hypothetical protein